MRKNLYEFRVSQRTEQGKVMTQGDFAEKIGVGRNQYAMIEQGNRNGSVKFWDKLKKAFDVPDAEIWRLTVNEE